MTATAQSARSALRELITPRLSDDARAWWAEREDAGLDATRAALADAARVAGRRPLISAIGERASATVDAPWGPVPVGEWRLDDAVRVALIAEAAQRADAPHQALFDTYDLGDTETRVACLRALNFVDGESPKQAMEMVHDAGRTYLEALMGAGWCNNPFSEAHLTPEEYRKAVLKALFCNVPVEGFLGLETRADAELAQSLSEYADERIAAGRPVPHPVWIVSAHHPRPGLVARLIGKLEDPLPVERLVGAKALANAGDPRARPFIEERLARETDPDVRQALNRASESSAAD